MADGTISEQEVELNMGEVSLAGTLARPHPSRGLVVFAHGSGSSRFSPRNRRVAEGLRMAGLATLLFNLLTPEEESVDRVSARFRFDPSLMASRLTGAVDWLRAEGWLEPEAHT